MPRWVKALGWAAIAWTAALAVAAGVAAITASCGDVAPSDLHVCELDRDSTISGIALVWFLGAFPLATLWLLGRARRARCRICGDELGAADRRVCRRCASRLIETAEPR